MSCGSVVTRMHLCRLGRMSPPSVSEVRRATEGRKSGPGPALGRVVRPPPSVDRVGAHLVERVAEGRRAADALDPEVLHIRPVEPDRLGATLAPGYGDVLAPGRAVGRRLDYVAVGVRGL